MKQNIGGGVITLVVAARNEDFEDKKIVEHKTPTWGHGCFSLIHISYFSAPVTTLLCGCGARFMAVSRGKERKVNNGKKKKRRKKKHQFENALPSARAV